MINCLWNAGLPYHPEVINFLIMHQLHVLKEGKKKSAK